MMLILLLLSFIYTAEIQFFNSTNCVNLYKIIKLEDDCTDDEDSHTFSCKFNGNEIDLTSDCHYYTTCSYNTATKTTQCIPKCRCDVDDVKKINICIQTGENKSVYYKVNCLSLGENLSIIFSVIFGCIIIPYVCMYICCILCGCIICAIFCCLPCFDQIKNIMLIFSIK